MTVRAVTDEQLGKFHKKIRLVEERIGKSLSFNQLMMLMQQIIDSGGVQGQSLKLIATNPREWFVPAFESDTPMPTSQLLEEAEYLVIDSSFVENVSRDVGCSVAKLLSKVWQYRDISTDTNPISLLKELSQRAVFESRSIFCFDLWRFFDPYITKIARVIGKNPPWLYKKQNLFFVNGWAGTTCLVRVTYEDGYWYLLAQNPSQGWLEDSVKKGSRVFYPTF